MTTRPALISPADGGDSPILDADTLIDWYNDVAQIVGWVDVKTDFDAVGDGAADDTTAIQNAIDHVDALTPGGFVFFPQGEYKITSGLTGTSSTSLVGDRRGNPNNHNLPIIIWGGAVNDTGIMYDVPYVNDNIVQWQIENLIFKAKASASVRAQTCIRVSGPSVANGDQNLDFGARLVNVHCIESTRDAISLQGGVLHVVGRGLRFDSIEGNCIYIKAEPPLPATSRGTVLLEDIYWDAKTSRGGEAWGDAFLELDGSGDNNVGLGPMVVSIDGAHFEIVSNSSDDFDGGNKMIVFCRTEATHAEPQFMVSIANAKIQHSGTTTGVGWIGNAASNALTYATLTNLKGWTNSGVTSSNMTNAPADEDYITLWEAGSSLGTYTPTNVSTDRSYDADSTSEAELADVLGTLIADLQAKGILG